MGYRPQYIEWMNKQISKVYTNSKNLSMLELGNQIISGAGGGPAKTYFTNLGYEHISVDLNGLNGALVKDLSKVEDFEEYKDYFDVVTNAGTIEHVEPFESQYDAFLIVHNSLKIGGVAIHIGPDIEFTKKGHCQYYYDKSFWDNIVEHSDYKFLGTENLFRWRHYAYQKIGNKFIDKQLLLDKIHRVNGPVGGMYTSGAHKKDKNRIRNI